MNSIPAVSAMSPISAYLPLAVVLGVSMIREGIEDYARYKSDKITNHLAVRFVSGGCVTMGEAKDVTVGDVLLIQEDEFFPADLILLASSTEEASCLIKTSSLDGESAPKMKKVPKGLDWQIPSGGETFNPSELLSVGKATIEGPSSNLYSLEGKIEIAKKTYKLTAEQMLLKGTQLVNTDWVVGFVAYTGKETRIMMNLKAAGSIKQSGVEKMMNRFTIYIVTFLLSLTLVLAILGGVWHSDATEISEELQE